MIGNNIWSGKKHSEETRKKLSILRLGVGNGMYGKKHTKEETEVLRDMNLGEKNHFFGKTHTDEARKKNSEFQKARSGVSAANWKGGISKINKRIRDQVRSGRIQVLGGGYSNEDWQLLKQKYGFMCLCCKKVEPEIKLTADHIVPITQWHIYTMFHHVDYDCGDIQNIQPLCRSCNSRKNIKVVDYRTIKTNA